MSAAIPRCEGRATHEKPVETVLARNDAQQSGVGAVCVADDRVQGFGQRLPVAPGAGRDALGGKDVVVAQYGYDAGDVVAPPYVASASYGVPACGCEE